MAMFKEHGLFLMDPKVVYANLPPGARARRLLLKTPTVIDHRSSDPILADPCLQRKPDPVPDNPTVLPTNFLHTMDPVCLIRHPAPMLESFYRAAVKGHLNICIHDEEFPVSTSLRWLRLLYDWYASFGAQPIVIEADDLINEDNVMPKFCKAFHLDPQYLQTRWEKESEEIKAKQGISETAFLETIQNSTGIIKSKKRDFEINIVEERDRWVRDFGEDVANALYHAAEDAMPDYMYLRSKRLA
jgi:hypothetical protein